MPGWIPPLRIRRRRREGSTATERTGPARARCDAWTWDPLSKSAEAPQARAGLSNGSIRSEVRHGLSEPVLEMRPGLPPEMPAGQGAVEGAPADLARSGGPVQGFPLESRDLPEHPEQVLHRRFVAGPDVHRPTRPVVDGQRERVHRVVYEQEVAGLLAVVRDLRFLPIEHPAGEGRHDAVRGILPRPVHGGQDERGEVQASGAVIEAEIVLGDPL